MSSQSIPTRRGGFSLIEVAIALAIFVFGALAIVQIFPPALGVIRNNESRVAATQLGESMLARSAGKPDRVPDAVYDIQVDDDGNPVLDIDDNLIWQDTPYAVVGTPSRNHSLPVGPTETQFANSALSRFKYIRGEKQIVRSGVIDGDDDPTSFVLLNHPYKYYPGDDILNGSTIRAYREVILEGVQIEGNGTLDFSLAVDSTGTAHSEPLSDLTYYISYRWQEENPVNPEDSTLHGVIDEPFVYQNLGTDFEKRVLQGWLDSSTNRVLAGNVAVYYREKVTLPLISAPVTEDEQMAKVGMVRITTNVGQTLSFDYLVDDWRMLVDESRPDVNGIVSLPIKNLVSDAGQTHALDITFEPNNDGLNLLFGSPALTPKSAKDGILDYGQNNNAVTRRARTIYQTLDGWAQQLSVAAKSYIPFYENTGWTESRNPESLPREPWREYLRVGNELFFHPSEAGKSLSVSYVNGDDEIIDVILTIDKTNPGAGIADDFFRNTGESISANDEKLIAPVTVTDVQGNTANVRSILSVKGLSVQARTAWQEGSGRYNQVILPGQRTLMH